MVMRISLATAVAACVAIGFLAGPKLTLQSSEAGSSSQIESVNSYGGANTHDIHVVLRPLKAPAASKTGVNVEGTFSSLLSAGLEKDWGIGGFSVTELINGKKTSKQLRILSVAPSDCNSLYEGETRFLVEDMVPGRVYRLEYRLVSHRRGTDMTETIKKLRSAKDGAFIFSASFEDSELSNDATTQSLSASDRR
jgi:hypothetical protein